MDDSEFLTKILECPKLADAVKDLASRSGAINLVTPDWKNVLESTDLYTRHRSHKVRFSKGRDVRDKSVNVKTVIGTHNHYNVLVAGYWSLSLSTEGSANGGSNPSFVCRLCAPLVSIGESMKESDQWKLQDNCRLFVETCNPVMCIECFKYRDLLLTTPDNNWCIRTTRVFNGETIKNTTRTVIEQTFALQGGFMGVLNLSLNSRLSFGDNLFKIGGVVKEMLLFKETSIYPRVEIDFDLPLPQTNIPSVTYPEDETYKEAIPAEMVQRYLPNGGS